MNQQHRIRVFLIAVLCAALLACNVLSRPTATPQPTLPPTATPAPLLSAILVKTQGRVEVARTGWADYQPAFFGMELASGDSVRTHERSKAEIVCEDGRGQIVDAEREEPLTCQQDIGLSPQVYELLKQAEEDRRGMVLPARESPADYGNVPVVLAPRNSRLQAGPPTFRWTSVDGATRYVVLVKSSGGEVWRGETEQTELIYPSDAPELTSDETYLFSIEAYLDPASKPRVSAEIVFFSLLSPEQAQQVQAFEDELGASSLPAASRQFIAANLYVEHELYHAAIVAYEALNEQDEKALYHNALGDVYVRIKLYRPAVEAHYPRAVELAAASDDKMAQAAAEAGLGRAYYNYGNDGEALRHLEEALRLYEELGATEQASWVSDLISRVQGHD